MSKLTKLLNATFKNLKNNYPDVAARIPPGLSYEQIEKITQTLPYKLPQEVYELYQFCGGWDWETENWDGIFAPWHDMTLRNPGTILEEIQYFEAYEVRYIGKPLIPIFGFDRTCLCVVGDYPEKHFSPIIHVSELYQVELDYVNLISMIQVTAKSYQSSAVYIDEEGFIRCDEKRFFAIYRKYNSDLPQMVLNRLRKELEIAGSDEDELYKVWNSLYENVCWLTKCWTELSIEQFKPDLIELIIEEAQKKDKTRYSHYARLILGELSS